MPVVIKISKNYKLLIIKVVRHIFFLEMTLIYVKK